MMNEGTILNCIFEFRPHPPKPPAGRIRNLAERTKASEKRNPYPQNICSAFPSPFELAH